MKTYRYVVLGRVQGVAFRFYAVQEAERLGICGTIRNLPDGSVEVYAQGPREALGELEVFLQRGPARARVERVMREDAGEREPFAGFAVAF